MIKQQCTLFQLTSIEYDNPEHLEGERDYKKEENKDVLTNVNQEDKKICSFCKEDLINN